MPAALTTEWMRETYGDLVPGQTFRGMMCNYSFFCKRHKCEFKLRLQKRNAHSGCFHCTANWTKADFDKAVNDARPARPLPTPEVIARLTAMGITPRNIFLGQNVVWSVDVSVSTTA